MKGLDNPTWLLLYIVSNLVALILLLASWKKPRLARLLFFLLFAWAGWTNWTTVAHTPEAYLGQADLTFFPFYRDFILGWFNDHIRLVVGFIATSQLLIALSMIFPGWILCAGGAGAIVFLVTIAPFGVGSAFPCTLVLAMAMFLVIRRRTMDFLWRRDNTRHPV